MAERFEDLKVVAFEGEEPSLVPTNDSSVVDRECMRVLRDIQELIRDLDESKPLLAVAFVVVQEADDDNCEMVCREGGDLDYLGSSLQYVLTRVANAQWPARGGDS